MSKQHTPLQTGRVCKSLIFDNKGDIAADCQSPQIAEMIVKSVNNHDRLVEALIKLAGSADHLLDSWGDESAKQDDLSLEISRARKLLTELKS